MRLLLLSLLLVALAQLIAAEAGAAAAPPSAAEQLRLGTAHLTSGRASAALAAFDAALAAELESPSGASYLTHFRRATALLSLGRTGAALQALDAALALNAHFAAAHLERARALAKDGQLDAAAAALKQFLASKPGDEAALALQASLKRAGDARRAAHKALLDVRAAAAKQRPLDSASRARADECARNAAAVLEVAPGELEVRRWRAECYAEKEELDEALADWR